MAVWKQHLKKLRTRKSTTNLLWKNVPHIGHVLIDRVIVRIGSSAGIIILATIEDNCGNRTKMKKTLLTGIAALFLATGTAHACED